MESGCTQAFIATLLHSPREPGQVGEKPGGAGELGGGKGQENGDKESRTSTSALVAADLVSNQN